MKPISLVSILAVWLGLAFNLHAAITVINDWHMGESDPDAVNGGFATNTYDSVGNDTLTNQPAAGHRYPSYTNNVSGAAAFLAGSDLCEFYYTNGQYAVGNVIPNLTTNFGLELWVYPTNGSGGQVIAYNGNTGGSGWGIYQSGTNGEIFFGGILISSHTVPLALNTWTELALVSTNGVVGLRTTNVATLYTNGIAAFSITNTPASPSGSFLIAGDNSGLENFSGFVDEVRVFTFAEGQFSLTNLLVNQPLVVTTTADSGPGSLRGAVAAANPGSSTITFTNTLSNQTILLGSALALNTSLTIDASVLPGGIQINGNGGSTVFSVASGVTGVLNSLTVTNGYASGNGGGIDINTNGTLTLNQCTLAGNGAGSGGGIYVNTNGTLTLNESTLSENNATGARGGGIFNNGMVTLDECTLAGNTASGSGGGIYNNGGTLAMTNSMVAGNSGTSGTNGADLYFNSGTVIYSGVNLVSSLVYAGGGILIGSAPLTNAPNLALLGNYGGPTQTMPPLPGSPAIGAGSVAANTFTTDQRGDPRTQNGRIDLGAVELPAVAPFTVNTNAGLVPLIVQFQSTNADSEGSTIVGWSWSFGDGSFGTGQNPNHVYNMIGVYSPSLIVTNSLGLALAATGPVIYVPQLVVSNTADSGPGSLRFSLATAAAGETITFAPSLSGQTIALSGMLAFNTSLTIDASALTGGIQIKGNNSFILFSVGSVTDVLDSLILINGHTSSNGGGIANGGTLTLNQCTLSGNSAVNGGAIANGGTLTLNECTLAGNSAANGGGGIFNEGTLMLNECTLTGNIAVNGGGIYSIGGITLNECTLSGNSAYNAGGGIYGSGFSMFTVSLALTNTIVASNATPDSVDLSLNNEAVSFGGSNLVESAVLDGVIYGPLPLTNAPDLAPLGNYGGPTQTMPPGPGSPAVDAGADFVTNMFATDQRGYPRLAGLHVDIGAVEGVYNANKSVLTGATSLPNRSFQFGFTNYEDMTYTVFATTNLALPFNMWLNLGYAVGAPAGSGQFQFTDTGATNSPQRFYRVVSP